MKNHKNTSSIQPKRAKEKSVLVLWNHQNCLSWFRYDLPKPLPHMLTVYSCTVYTYVVQVFILRLHSIYKTLMMLCKRLSLSQVKLMTLSSSDLSMVLGQQMMNSSHSCRGFSSRQHQCMALLDDVNIVHSGSFFLRVVSSFVHRWLWLSPQQQQPLLCGRAAALNQTNNIFMIHLNRKSHKAPPMGLDKSSDFLDE